MSGMLSETRRLLSEYGIRPSRRLGQNFLVSRRAIGDILRAVNPEPSDTILEVGAGLGTLTLELARVSGRVIAVEIDRRLVKVLRSRLGGRTNVEIVEGDILGMPIPGCDKVVGSIPYYISSSLLVKLLREPVYSYAVLTFQREFAERLVAQPGSRNYGRLSVLAQLFSRIEILGVVDRRAFYPVPKVDSMLVKLAPSGPLDHMEKVERVTRVLFSQRRRLLKKALRRLPVDTSKLGGEVDLGKRVYELTPGEILLIALAVQGERE